MNETPIRYCEEDSSLRDQFDFKIADNVNADSAPRIVEAVNNHEEMLERLKDLSSRLTGDPDAFVEAALKAMALIAKIDKEKEMTKAAQVARDLAHDKTIIDWFKDKGHNISVLGVDQ